MSTTLTSWLQDHSSAAPSSLQTVIQSIASSVVGIRTILDTTIVKQAGTTNAYDDEQLNVDLATDDLISKNFKSCPHIAAWSSEENPVITTSRPELTAAKGGYFVAFDPLDGSSIVDVNWSVGSIFGVWPGLTPVGQKVGDIVASAAAVYGPRCTLFVAIKGYVAIFTYRPKSKVWRLWSKTATIGPKAKYFSPGNLRATQELPEYKAIVEDYMQRKITLRYTGGMVPDITQMFIKGSGIFMTPSAPNAKMKLRVCYECGPLAFLVEQAGGRTSEGFTFDSYLEKVVQTTNDRSGIVCGSKEDVEKYLQIMTKQLPQKSKL